MIRTERKTDIFQQTRNFWLTKPVNHSSNFEQNNGCDFFGSGYRYAFELSQK